MTRTAKATAETGAASKPPWRVEVRAFAELMALCGFAIAQPLLDLFGRNPSQFVFRGAEGPDIIQFALLVTFLPPLVLWLLEVAVGRLALRARSGVHLALVALLVAMFVVQVARNLLPAAVLFLVAAAVGVGAAGLGHRVQVARLWLGYAAFAPLAFLGLFLFNSSTAGIIFADNPRIVEAGVGNPVPVVMVVLDEFPLATIVDSDGNIDRDLYPNLAELADRSHWFRNTTTVSGSTSYAVPAIVTGRYPEEGADPIAADHPESLFTLLGDAYDMNVAESVTRLCPTDLCRSTVRQTGGRGALAKDALEVMQARLSYSGTSTNPVTGLVEAPVAATPQLDEDGFNDFDLNQPERFRALVDDLDDDPAALHYLHILLPHVPYRYLPSGQQYDDPKPDQGQALDLWIEHPWLPRLSRQRLQLQVAYVDALVGDLVSTMRERGLYDDALFVLTADHGISFQPGGSARSLEGQSLDADNTAELMWVPLFVKVPGQQQGSVSDANVETIDILPTIADVLEINLPWSVDGRSAFGPKRPDNTKIYVGNNRNPFSVEAVGPVEIDGDAGWKSVLANAVDTVLPPAGEDRRLWRIGPASDLVGTSVDAAPDGWLTPVSATLLEPEGLGEVDPAAETVPALVHGTVEDLAPDAPIAVSVNGVVTATAITFPGGEAAEFAVMVDPLLFRPGANDLRVYRITR